MDTQLDVDTQPRVPLSRERVLRAAVALADEHGVEAISMRRIAGELGVVPMALYKHVSSKDELLDGMIDVVVGEIGPPAGGTDGKAAIRRRVLSAGARSCATGGRPGSSSRGPIRPRWSSRTWTR